MKKIFKFSFVAILGIGILSSCAKKDNTTTTTPTQSMSATLGGTAWSASTVSAITNSGILAVSGAGSNSSYIIIGLPANIAAGTYSVDSTQSTYSVQYSTGSASYYMMKGTLVISSNANNAVSGTFSGKMEDLSNNTLTLTNGAFSAKY